MKNLQEDDLSFILLLQLQGGVRTCVMIDFWRRRKGAGCILYVDFRPLRLQESFAAWNLELRREEARFMRQQLVNGRMRKAAREGEREGADNRQRCNWSVTKNGRRTTARRSWGTGVSELSSGGGWKVKITKRCYKYSNFLLIRPKSNMYHALLS